MGWMTPFDLMERASSSKWASAGASRPPGTPTAPRGRRRSRRFRKASVVGRQEAGQHGLGLRARRSPRQPQFADQPVLEGSPQPLDPALGLRGAGRDQRDAQLVQGPTHLRPGPLPRELLRQRGLPVRPEDGVPIRIDGLGQALVGEHVLKEMEIGLGRLLLDEAGPGDLGGGVIDGPD